MPDPQSTDSNRRRWINLGEGVAVIGLIISGLALWNSWSNDDKPAVVIEKPTSIPLALRGRVADDGRKLDIAPIEDGHALQSMTLAMPTSGGVIEIGSDGELLARAIESALNRVDEGKGIQRLRVRIAARYVEAGTDKRATGSYLLTLRWEGGGLFGGRSLRFVGMTKA